MKEILKIIKIKKKKKKTKKYAEIIVRVCPYAMGTVCQAIHAA